MKFVFSRGEGASQEEVVEISLVKICLTKVGVYGNVAYAVFFASSFSWSGNKIKCSRLKHGLSRSHYILPRLCSTLRYSSSMSLRFRPIRTASVSEDNSLQRVKLERWNRRGKHNKNVVIVNNEVLEQIHHLAKDPYTREGNHIHALCK